MVVLSITGVTSGLKRRLANEIAILSRHNRQSKKRVYLSNVRAIQVMCIEH
jgi:hypothetical protein